MNAPDAWPVSLWNAASEPPTRFVNTFARLPDALYTRVAPTPIPQPSLVAVSPDACALVGLDADAFDHDDRVAAFAGNRPIAGAEPLAAVYSGHQFGVWAGQLGDGRAIVLGEVDGPRGRWEIQLKGAGKTPYSRFADGRAVLRSSIREFLCSEAMDALGIPTTRALCIVGSPLPVRRETLETAAVVTRLAPTFVRFGSFEHWASRNQVDLLRTLADYVIDGWMPAARDSTSPYAAMLAEIAHRTGVMVAHWQAVGFMHGVMNTDNMSILGLTLDYGPFGFMDAFDAGHICNHSDEAGRYAFDRQPDIAFWNLQALASALLPLIGDEDTARHAIVTPYTEAYNATFEQQMHAKLGLATVQPGDDALIESLFALMQREHPDLTAFFRALSRAGGVPGDEDAPIRDLFIDRDACDAWLARWRDRLGREASIDGARQIAMLRVNPKYTLRNWVAEEAIRAARGGDHSVVADLLKCLRRPFDEHPEHARWASPPPDWAAHLEVSCSS